MPAVTLRGPGARVTLDVSTLLDVEQINYYVYLQMNYLRRDRLRFD